MFHPHVAFRDCDHCQAWQYEERGDNKGQVAQWQGKPLPRVGKPPCRASVGCPKGTPENPKTLTTKNMLALAHYRRCKAVGRFPDDEIVARNASIIRSIEQRHEQHHLAMLLGVAATKRT